MAAACPLVITFFLCSILLFQTICASGAFLDFSYDSTQVMVPSSSVITDYRVLVTEKQHAYIFLKPFECRARTCSSKHLASLFVSEVLVPNQHLNFSNVIVTATERQLGALRRTLRSVHDSLGAAGLATSIRVSPELSLSSVIMAKNRVDKRNWGKVMEFVRKSGLFVQVEMEAEVNDVLVIAAAMHEAVADFAALSGADAGVVLHLKRRGTAPSAVEMARLVGEISRVKRISGLLVDVSSPRRELAAATRATVHDEVTNPVTVPATNPATNPVSPGIVTVPSTNPGMGFASNSNLPPLYPQPTTPTPVTMPDPTTTTPTTMPYPVTSPVPDMNPVTAPTMPGSTTNPTAPVTNPATTPTTVTNPATTYPDPQQGGGGTGGGMPTAPVYQPPASMPGGTVYQPPASMPGGTMQPAAPTVGGQTWCIAKTGLTDTVLQSGIDYACGIGGADCSALQPMGSCYNPNTVQAHASYAFNSYFQKNPSPASCDFGGAGMLVNVNPSSGTCMYQTSGAGFSAGNSPGVTGTVPTGGYIPGTGPTGTTTGAAMGGGSGSTVLNANNPGGNSMYGGYDNPTSLSAGSASLSCGWVLCLIWMITFAFVKEKV